MLVYLDNNATTRLDPRVLEAMAPYLTEQYGNASSAHRFGATVMAAVERAREQVASLIGARPSEVVFTSGGTEADNGALLGVAWGHRGDRRRVLLSSVEHPAVLAPAELLERQGFEVEFIPVHADGTLDLDSLDAALDERTLLVSVMLANNETGVRFPVREVARRARKVGALCHTDAVNALGKIEMDVRALEVDLLSVSAHKCHGPKGVGALFLRDGMPFHATMLGGAQERERRGGTYNTAGIVGFGAACALVQSEGLARMPAVSALRDRFEAELRRLFPDARVLGESVDRLPNTCCVCLPGVEAQALVLLLSEAGICVSSGAACASGSSEPSHVLTAMGVSDEWARGQIRFSLSRETSDAEIERTLERLPQMARLSGWPGLRP